MKNINLGNVKTVYFIGIGGVSMSGLAHILHSLGYNIKGSDTNTNLQTTKLENIGIEINYIQKSENITDDIDLIVYTAAIREDNEEYTAGKQKNIKMYSRAKLLGKIIDTYEKSICISGTHGKTTTTSMISNILLNHNLRPTISVGAVFEKINGNFHLGSSDYFVVESCEYNDSFLEFRPYIGTILNLEYDHPDHFKNLEQLENSFLDFAKNVKGYIIINKKIKNVEKFIKNTNAKIILFGEGSDEFDYKIISQNRFIFQDKDITIPVFGIHNIENAVASLCVAKILGININAYEFENYLNPKRRLEQKGITKNGVIVFDDYAHHPTEIKFTLEAIKNMYPNKKINCVFQPHTYSRTKGLLNDFSKCFESCDNLFLLDIFGAREKSGDIHIKDLKNLIKNVESTYFKNFEECEKFLSENLKNDDLLITMGATNVNLIGEALFRK
ncbi:MAG: UDP-N-acetylmuramate--L-alanine ligase [Defluviitaleaceae bacterium]|nr:UDP-N-acetylmuramate--L-alanine ligase [Defluviitaleaceae bacterium]